MHATTKRTANELALWYILRHPRLESISRYLNVTSDASLNSPDKEKQPKMNLFKVRQNQNGWILFLLFTIFCFNYKVENWKLELVDWQYSMATILSAAGCDWLPIGGRRHRLRRPQPAVRRGQAGARLRNRRGHPRRRRVQGHQRKTPKLRRLQQPCHTPESIFLTGLLLRSFGSFKSFQELDGSSRLSQFCFS